MQRKKLHAPLVSAVSARSFRRCYGHEFQAKFHWHVEDLGIRHSYIKRGTLQLNGKVERSHRSDRQEFYQLLSYKGDVDLEAKLDEWERFYNFHRPHSAYTLTLTVAVNSGDFGWVDAAHMLGIEAGGGALFGLVVGYTGYHAMKQVDDHMVEILVSLAVATGCYATAQALHLSGPISVVVAGVLIGNRGTHNAISDETKRYLFGFWDLIDGILNATLFLLIGLEVIVFRFQLSFAWIGIAAIPVVVLARFIAVAGTVHLLRPWNPFPVGSIPILVWGAVRGAISVALALSIPANEARPYILDATYSVVLFTAIGQGLSLKRVIRASR